MRLSFLTWSLTGLSGSDSSLSFMSSSSVKQSFYKRTLVKSGRWKMGRVLAAGALSVLMLSACGQKGELYLPEDDASRAVVDDETVQLGNEVSSDPNDF